ncbi:MAG: heme exporter protein CcmD [Paracoccaceae bacterium]
MPDLGKYAFSVLMSYGLSFILIICLVAYILYRNSRARNDLEKEERL